MSKVSMTVRQITDLGLWDKVCEYKGWNPYIKNYGQIDDDETVEFDSEFKKDIETKTMENLNKFKQAMSDIEDLAELYQVPVMMITKAIDEFEIDFDEFERIIEDYKQSL